MREFGRIAHVTRVQLGDELAEAAEATDTTITVVDAADFDEDGGTLTIGDEEIVYLSADDETGVITLAEGLANAYEEGERVLLDGYEYQAGVVLGLDDEMITARVPSDMVDSQALAEGERDAVRESVLLENEHEEWRIVEVLGVDLVRDGSYIDGDTLPTPPLSDGEAPESSPTPTLEPLPGGFLIKWTGIANADPVTYQVHISTSSGFTAGSSTRIADTPGVMVAIFSLPDGTELDDETTYYVRTIAYDRDGAADQSTEASGQPGPSVSAEDLEAIESAVEAAAQAAADAEAAAEGAQLLAASKRRVFFQDSEPAGDLDEHDLWFDTNDGNAIYRYDGDSWEQAELDTSAFAAESITANEIAAGAVVAGKIAADAVEAGNIAAGAVQAGDIAAEAVTAENIAAESILSQHLTASSISAEHVAAAAISAGHLASSIVLSSLIQTAESGRRIEISNEGLYAFEQDDSSLLSVPTDGTASILNMDVVAKSLLAQTGAILRGTSRLTKGATLELESATETPMVAPAMQHEWQYVTLPENIGADQKYGLYYDASSQTFFYCAVWGGGNGSDVVQIDMNGDTVDTWHITGQSGRQIKAHGGITRLGDDFFVLAYRQDNNSWYVYRYDDEFDLQASWQYTDEPAGSLPHIGNDGTHIIIARCAPNDSNRIKIRTYDASTGAEDTGAIINGPTMAKKNDVCGLLYGNFDFGANRYVVAYKSGDGQSLARTLVFNTSGVEQTNETWQLGISREVGLAWDATRFWSLSPADHLTKYSTSTWTSQSSTWWAAYSLRDGDSTGGMHETALSPKQRFTAKRRAFLRWSVPSIPDSGSPDDPDRVRIWIGRGNSEPADSAMWLNDEPDPGEVTGQIELPVFTGTNFASGQAAAFEDSVPAEIRTVDGIPLIRANGFPQVKVNRTANQTMSGPDGSIILWDTEVVDTDDFWASSPAARINCPFTGQYLITVSCTLQDSGNTTGRRMWVESSSNNGSTWSIMPALQQTTRALEGLPTWMNISAVVNQTQGNVMRVLIAEHGAGDVTLSNAQFAAVYLGPGS